MDRFGRGSQSLSGTAMHWRRTVMTPAVGDSEGLSLSEVPFSRDAVRASATSDEDPEEVSLADLTSGISFGWFSGVGCQTSSRREFWTGEAFTVPVGRQPDDRPSGMVKRFKVIDLS